MLKHYRLNRSSPDDDEKHPAGEEEENSDHEKENQKIKFEIKPLPRPQAPEHLKRQASLRAFVPRYVLFYNFKTRSNLQLIIKSKYSLHSKLVFICIFPVKILTRLPSKI